MAGIQNNLRFDCGYQQDMDRRNQQVDHYNLYRQAHMRPDVVQAPFLSAALQPSTFGPLTGRRVTQESFLRGLGQCRSEDPNYDVIHLPVSLFPQGPQKMPTGQRIDLFPQQTRTQKSCNGLSETDVTAYRFSPERFQPGYVGYNVVVPSGMQTRDSPWDPSMENYAPNAQMYGERHMTKRLVPYSSIPVYR